MNASIELGFRNTLQFTWYVVLDVWNGVESAPLKVGFRFGEQNVVRTCQIWLVRRLVKNSNAFLYEKLVEDSCFVGASIIVQRYKAPANFPSLRSWVIIFRTVSLLTSNSSAVFGSDRWRFCSNSCRTFSMLPSVRDSEGRLLWGLLEHLPSLHETVHTSEKCCMVWVLHLHRLHTPFKQFLLQFHRL